MPRGTGYTRGVDAGATTSLEVQDAVSKCSDGLLQHMAAKGQAPRAPFAAHWAVPVSPALCFTLPSSLSCRDAGQRCGLTDDKQWDLTSCWLLQVQKARVDALTHLIQKATLKRAAAAHRFAQQTAAGSWLVASCTQSTAINGPSRVSHPHGGCAQAVGAGSAAVSAQGQTTPCQRPAITCRPCC